ncbi:MAG: hypothetical protein CMD30_02075 [Flavobacteriales bacterium]|nr:hypothetical protein [Flavobacteriales bacterium]
MGDNQKAFLYIKESFSLGLILLEESYSMPDIFKKSSLFLFRVALALDNKKYLEESINDIKKIDDYNRAIIYNEIIDLLIDNEYLDTIIQLIDELNILEKKLELFSKIAKSIANSKGDIVLKLIEKSLDLSKEIENNWELSNALHSFCELLMKLKREDLVNEIIVQLSTEDKQKAYADIGVFYFNDGDLIKSDEYFKRLESWAQFEFVRKLLKESLVVKDEVFSYVEKISDAEESMISYQEIVRKYLITGDLNSAKEICEKHIKSYWDRYVPYRDALSEVSLKVKMEILKECLLICKESMKEVIKTKSEMLYDSTTEMASDLIEFLIEIKNKDEARNLIDQIFNLKKTMNINSTDVVYNIIKNLYRMGNYKEAFNCFYEIEYQFDYWTKDYLSNDLSNITTIYDSMRNILTLNPLFNPQLFIKSISHKFKESKALNEDVFLFLYNFTYNLSSLPNILFYWAKMACFFEDERNEEKLDMLSEVIDIKDWRRISA